MTEPALRLVDDNGVLMDEDYLPPPSKYDDELTEEERLRRELAEAKVQLQGAEREIKAWRVRYAAAVEDKEAKARKDKLWPKAEKLFQEWQKLTGHTRSKWSYDRFEKVRPYLKSEGYDLCLLAIQGVAYDPYQKMRANGTIKKFDDFEQPFSERRKFEDACNRAPKEALAAYKAKQPEQQEIEGGDDA